MRVSQFFEMAQTDVLPAFFLMKGPQELFDREGTIIIQKKPEFIRSVKEDVLDEFSQFLKLVFPHCLIPDICPRRCWAVKPPFILDTVLPILYGLDEFSQFLKLVFPQCLVPQFCASKCWSIYLPFILDTIPPILYGIASFIRKARSREYFMAFSTRQTVLQRYYYFFYYFSGEGSVH